MLGTAKTRTGIKARMIVEGNIKADVINLYSFGANQY